MPTLPAKGHLFTPDQYQHHGSIQGPRDQAGLGSFRDRLQDDEHPLWPLFGRAHEWAKLHPEAVALPWDSPNAVTGDTTVPGYSNPIGGRIEQAFGPPRQSILWQFPEPFTVGNTIGHYYVHTGLIKHGSGYARGAVMGGQGTRYAAPLRKEELEKLTEFLTQQGARKIRIPVSRYERMRPVAREPNPLEPDQLSREQPVTPGKIADALQDAAKEVSQKPYGAVYISPSTREGSTFQHALAEFGKGVHSEILKQAERFGPSYPMLGVWVDGAEEGALVETDPAVVKKVGALLALKHKQKAFATFTPDNQASGGQHVVELQEPWPVDRLHQYLQSKGVQYGTFLPTQHDPRLIEVVHVLTGSPEESQHAHDALAPLGKHHFTPGQAEFVGAATRGEATALYRKLLGG